MKLATTTSDIKSYYEDKSVATPLNDILKTGFRHIDLSMTGVLYKDSPWLTKDGWKKEIEECIKIAELNGFDFCQAHSPYINAFESEEPFCINAHFFILSSFIYSSHFLTTGLFD